MSKPRIGFIGVGLMGHGMARNIVEKGYPLTIVGNRNREPVDDLVARGASEVATPKEAAVASDIVFLCVSDSSIVEKVIEGPGGIIEAARAGLIVVDTSTSNPNSTLALAAKLNALGMTLLDAPLGRTPKDAEAGTLDVMIGADDASFAIVEPVLKCFSARIVRVGAVGTGHKMKLMNNFLSMTYGALYSEALALSQRIGISPQTFDSVVRGGRMDCGFYQTFMKYVLERDENAHRFSLKNAHKDMRYVAEMANAAGVANPIGAAARNYYAMAEATGNGDKMVPMLSDFVAALNGTRLDE
jgi:3-hydroxyisobutyrate dehydrogenase-like beta-hydroxyacid dehydrogenase